MATKPPGRPGLGPLTGTSSPRAGCTISLYEEGPVVKLGLMARGGVRVRASWSWTPRLLIGSSSAHLSYWSTMGRVDGRHPVDVTAVRPDADALGTLAARMAFHRVGDRAPSMLDASV